MLLALNIIDLGTDPYINYFTGLEYQQTAPPLFMAATRLLYTISNQTFNLDARDFIIKLIPLISGVLSVPLFAYAVHKIFKNNYMTLIAAALLSLNPFAINYSQGFKQYSTELLFTVILFLAFCTLNLKEAKPKKLFLYSLLFAIAPFFSYASIYILMPAYFYTIFEIIKNKVFDKSKLFAFFVPITFALICFFCHYIAINNKWRAFMDSCWSNHYMSVNDIGAAVALFSEKVNNIFCIFDSRIFPYIFLAGLVFFVCKSKIKPVAIILGSIATVLTACFLDKYPFECRLIVFLIPFFIIIVSSIGYAIKENDRLTKFIAAIILITVTAFQLGTSHRKRIFIPLKIREFTKTVINDNNTDMVVSYAGQYYFEPFKDKFIYIDNKCAEKELIKHHIDKLPKNKRVWICMFHMLQSTYNKEGYLLPDIKEYIKSKGYKILDYKTDEPRNREFIIKIQT